MDIRVSNLKSLVDELNIKNEVIEQHYRLTTDFCETSDITSDEMIEFVADLLYDNYGGEFEDFDYEKKASEIIDYIADEVIEEIINEDRKAEEDFHAREEGRKGNY